MSLLEKIKSREDNIFAIGIAWTFGLLWFTGGGFYLGTIVGKKHEIDLQVRDMAGPGLTGMLTGFLVGVVVALLVTFIYPNYTSREKREEEQAH